jgi:hypothetical protein
MKKIFLKTTLFLMLVLMPTSVLAMGHVDVGVRIPLPPPLLFPVPPWLVVIPETDVYAVPDIQEDIFFYSGWWWRPWQNRWYRSRYHDRDWAYYEGAPPFHGRVPSNWRNDYNQQRWKGHQWEQRRVPHHEVERNWSGWQKDRHWEKQNYWGVRGLDTRQRQQGYNYQGRNNHQRGGDIYKRDNSRRGRTMNHRR